MIRGSGSSSKGELPRVINTHTCKHTYIHKMTTTKNKDYFGNESTKCIIIAIIKIIAIVIK